MALLDNDEVDVAGYRQELDRMAREISKELPAEADEPARLTALNKYLFDEHGFHGSRGDYYHRSNSYVNEVLDDREGLPDHAVGDLHRTGAQDRTESGGRRPAGPLHGPAMSRRRGVATDRRLRARADRSADAGRKAGARSIRTPADRCRFRRGHKAGDHRAHAAQSAGAGPALADAEGMLRYVDAILAISPDAGQERFMRAVLLLQNGRRAEAIADADWLLEHHPEGINLNQVDELRRVLDKLD